MHPIIHTRPCALQALRLGRYGRIVCCFVLLALLVNVPAPAHAQSAAAAAAQAAEPIPLMTGEYAWLEMAAGEQAAFSVDIPVAGQYFFSPDEEAGDPGNFSLRIIDPEGEELFSGAFGAVKLKLAPGPHTLRFTAAADDVLAFFLLGNVGALAEDPDAPGQLYPGTVYGEADVDGERYGLLSLPGTPYPQEVLLFVYTEPADARAFVQAEGDAIRFASLDTAKDNMLRFWMEGGEALVTVDPGAATAFSVVIMLSGPPEALDLDATVATTLEPGDVQVVRRLVVDDYHPSATVEVRWNDPEVDLSAKVVDDFDNPDFIVFGDPAESEEGSPLQRIELEHLVPGVYYLVVDSFSRLEESLPVTLRTAAEPAGDIPTLTSGAPLEASMAENSTALFRFDVAEAGSLVTVELAAADEETTDFDINVTRRPGAIMESSRTFAASESVAFLAPGAGLYFVEVASEAAGDFTLTMTEHGPAPLIAANEVLRGEVDADTAAFYRLPIEDADQLFSAVLVGDGAADVDLEIELLDAKGRLLHSLRSASERPFEIVALAAPTPGIYTVKVTAYDNPSSFALLPRLENPFTFFVATLNVVNRGEADICSLFVTPQGDLFGVQVNRLDPDAPLAPGETFPLELDAGRYDLQALDCDGNVVAESENVLLQGLMSWPIP